jgi:hypothetical protein
MKEYATENKDGYVRYPLGIVIALPFHLRLPDKEPQLLKFNGHDATLIFEKKRKYRETDEETGTAPFNKVIPLGGEVPVYYSEAVVFFTDVTFTPKGEYHFSDMGRPNKLKAFYENVIATDEQMKHYENEGDTFRIIKVALKILNTFISQYRLETQYYFTRFARFEDFPVVRMLAISFKPIYKAVPGVVEEINNVSFHAQYVYPMTTRRYIFSDATSEQCRRITSRIDHEEEVSVVDELILSANNHFNDGNFRHALIDIESAFEVAMQTQVERHLKATWTSEQKMEGILNCWITNLVKDHYPNCADAKPFTKGMDIYEKWRWACSVRNDVVHSNRVVKEEEFWTAFGCYHAVFEYLFDRPTRIELK